MSSVLLLSTKYNRFTLQMTISIMKTMNKRSFYQQGSASGWMIAAIGAFMLFLVAGAFSIWAYLSFVEQKSDVDGKVKIAVSEGKREQAEEDFKKFQEELKNPRIEFVGPEEYGRVSFMYPRTWSVYVEKDGSDRGDYKAYFHPKLVPPIGLKDSRYAFRVEIINKDYDTVLAQYSSALKKGDLASTTPEFNGRASTRLDGAFTKDLRGAVVLMRIQDKTLRFSTDADTFKPDFQTVLDTINFKQ